MIHRIVTASIGLLLALTVSVPADVRLHLELEQSSCLQFEGVLGVVTVRNDTDSPLLIGDASRPGRVALEFDVTREGDDIVPKGRPTPIVDNVIIKPDETRRLAVDVSRWYNMNRMGRYIVRAVLRKGHRMTHSQRQMIDIVRGLEIASKTRRVPGYADLSRTYSLRYWKRGRHEYVFLVVNEEPSGLNYGVFQLGRIIRVSKPALSVDRKGKVEIRHQCGPDCYIRTVFKSKRDGVHFIDQRYELPNGAPYPFLRPTVKRPGKSSDFD